MHEAVRVHGRGAGGARRRHCPSRKPPFYAVKRPARPHKRAILEDRAVGCTEVGGRRGRARTEARVRREKELAAAVLGLGVQRDLNKVKFTGSRPSHKKCTTSVLMKRASPRLSSPFSSVASRGLGWKATHTGPHLSPVIPHHAVLQVCDVWSGRVTSPVGR